MRRPAPLGPIPSNEALNLSSAKISHECYHPRRAMPILPVNHSDPFAATLGVMLYPGVDEASQRQARAFTAQALAEPLRRFHEAGHRLAYEDLARIFSDAGTPLDDIKQRWWDGLSTGETFKALFALAYTDRTLASWGNATKLAELAAEENKVHASRSSLYDARSRYGSVAHLWAAWCIRERRFQSDPDNGYEFWHDFQFFLAEAEILRQWGQSWRADRAKSKPPLPEEAWCVPESWEPPERQDVWPPTGRIHELTIRADCLAHLRRPGRPKKVS